MRTVILRSLFSAMLVIIFSTIPVSANADPASDDQLTVQQADVVEYVMKSVLDPWADYLQVRHASWEQMPLAGITCGSTTYGKTGGAYCWDRDGVLYFNRMVFGWQQKNRIGIHYALGHEFGHYLQDVSGLLYKKGTSSSYERQANCISGAMIGWYMKTHPEVGITNEDIRSLENDMTQGDGDARHGPSRQLRDAYDTGYRSGIGACNALAVIERPLPGS